MGQHIKNGREDLANVETQRDETTAALQKKEAFLQKRIKGFAAKKEIQAIESSIKNLKASLVDSETERARLVETLDADVRRRAECVEEGKQCSQKRSSCWR